MREKIFRDLPTLVELADKVFLRHFDVVEKRLTERRLAGNEQDRFGRDPLQFHVEQDEADPLVLGRRKIRAHQAEDPVRLVGVGGPDFLAVDEEMIALVLGFRRERREIRPRVRLGIALAPANFAVHDLRQVFASLSALGPTQQRNYEQFTDVGP